MTSPIFSSNRFQYIDSNALVDREITANQSGWVKYSGSWWRARCSEPITILPGTAVRITGREDLTLVVEPMVAAVAA
ncbi:MAG: NfeD family protein [Cyanobacteria bacterium P01_A01_bin.135]